MSAMFACTHHLGDSLPWSQLYGQTQIRESTLALAVQQHVLGLHVSIYNIHSVEMQDTCGDLCCVVDDTLHLDAFVHSLAIIADVVDVVLEVSSIHQGHDKAQVGLGVISVGQVDQKEAVNLLQDLLLQEGHLLTALLLQPFLTQLFAGVHLACVLDLHSTYLRTDRLWNMNKSLANVLLQTIKQNKICLLAGC